MASTTPSSTTSPPPNVPSSADQDENLQRKRARDRKSQRAMRERTKWTIDCLNAQVAHLTRALEEETRSKNELCTQLLALGEENDHLRVQKAALQLRLLGNNDSSIGQDGSSRKDSLSVILEPHEGVPLNTAPTCLSDQILQSFVESKWEAYMSLPAGATRELYPDTPDLSALFDGRPNRSVDETGAIVGDIVRSYTEIDTLPKQVAVHYVMSTLMKWLVLRTKQSFEQMPEWLRPEKSQLDIPHPSWIDRIPWPKVRTYLIGHPEITLDDFASAYSTSFFIRWEYDPTKVIISSGTAGILINPIYEEHMRQLRNWSVGEVFRRKFPEMSEMVDSYSLLEGAATLSRIPLHALPRYAI